jgi:hypothetical protein
LDAIKTGLSKTAENSKKMFAKAVIHCLQATEYALLSASNVHENDGRWWLAFACHFVCRRSL